MSTSVICKHCDRQIGSPQGLVSHIKSMHPEQVPRRPLASVPPPTSSNGIRWEDPPTTSRGGKVLDRFRPFVAELKRNPGRWARCVEYKGPTSAGSSVSALRKAFPDLEIVGRRVGAGSAIFARFVEPD